jgi:hypothetical protein
VVGWTAASTLSGRRRADWAQAGGRWKRGMMSALNLSALLHTAGRVGITGKRINAVAGGAGGLAVRGSRAVDTQLRRRQAWGTTFTSVVVGGRVAGAQTCRPHPGRTMAPPVARRAPGLQGPRALSSPGRPDARARRVALPGPTPSQTSPHFAER